MGAGIDYGLGQTNIDHTTGIRYGVIPQGEVLQEWSDNSEGQNGEPHCPECEAKVIDASEVEEPEEGWKGNGSDYVCENCNTIYDSEQVYPEEALEYTYEGEGYACSQSGDDTDIFILKSPYYTLCAYCSPCAPGAGYVMDTREDGIKAYCFGHDWFEDNIAPYPVYRVEDDKQVIASEETVPCRYCAGQGKRSLVELAKVRQQTLEQVEEGVKSGSIVASKFDPIAHTIECWCCNGRGNVEEVVERIVD